MKKTKLSLASNTQVCDNVLVNREKDSVQKRAMLRFSRQKMPLRDVEARQCKDLFGYANQSENLFDDIETQLRC